MQYRMQGDINWIAHDFDSDDSTTQTTITGLASNTHYEAQLRAVNVEGLGRLVADIQCQDSRGATDRSL